MTIELNERTVGVWFIQLTPAQDWLASIFTTDEGELKAIYRFRYYVDDKAFDSEDKKNWWEMTSTKTIAETVENFREIYDKLWQLSGGDHYEILMDENGMDDFTERFRKLPFVNSMEISKEEAKWMGYSPMEDKNES